MDYYNRTYKFKIQDLNEFESKLFLYLEYYKFKNVEKGKGRLVFTKKGSVLDGWKFNPLNWESKIDISITDSKEVTVNYYVSGNGQVTPVAFTSLFHTFIANLELFINHDKDFKNSNKLNINLAKKKLMNFFALIIGGIIVGFFIGFAFANLTNNNLYGYIGIAMGGILTQKILNNFIIGKSTEKQHI